MDKIFQWFVELNIQIQVLIISSVTTITIFSLKGLGKLIYEKYSFEYQMKKEYDFNQRKRIKEGLAKTKTPLIKAAEELNYRLWNLTTHIDEGWHNIGEEEWKDEKRYYLRSFVYRLLSFFFWILEAEKSIYSFDLSKADSKDKLYLKYIKTLKHFFCERELLDELDYATGMSSNHFYKDNLIKYASYVEKNRRCMTFLEFEKKFQHDYEEIRKVVKYITTIKSDTRNLNYNILKAFHPFLMLFLNKYGLDYHFTPKNKIRKLLRNKYSDLIIRKGLLKFIERNKLFDESKFIMKEFTPK